MGLGHAAAVVSEWKGLQKSLSSSHVIVDGQSLELSDVIAVSTREAGSFVTTDSRILERVERSVDFVRDELKGGRTIYGVTTGFGGSADVRTSQHEALQTALQQLLQVGILLPSDKIGSTDTNSHSHALPVSVVRGMTLIRCNSLLRGHSSVRLSIINALLTLLNSGMTPVIPLRGSISASGDLMPLSYLAGLIEGNPDIYVQITSKDATTHVVTADRALSLTGLQPIKLIAKEGLGIANGTATSCAAACIAIHQAQQLAVLSQLLTAMCTEALLGTAGNYHPFISEVRPHSGQAEAASNILAFLSGSQLALDVQNPQTGLAQDRYGLRTAPQWIGPQLEDLMSARQQVQVEINSTTDNPLIDVAGGGAIHHGGNFQAASLTSAMEKTKSALQMLGKLLYAQCSELVNDKLNKGLPPNLAADDPSTSFTFKGFDINMAAYMSELAFLGHSVGAHVQTAEMNNQSVNSLALIAARFTLDAGEIVSLMVATYLFALCQALDLRCLHREWAATAEPIVRELARKHLGRFVEAGSVEALTECAWSTLLERWDSMAHLDLQDRSTHAAQEAISPLMQMITTQSHASIERVSAIELLQVIDNYSKASAVAVGDLYDRRRSAFFEHQTTPMYLSTASRIMYQFVRTELGIPFHRGLADHPTMLSAGDNGRDKKLLGSMASIIYGGLRDGRMHDKIVEAVLATNAVNEHMTDLNTKRLKRKNSECTLAPTPPSESEGTVQRSGKHENSSLNEQRLRNMLRGLKDTSRSR